MSTKKKWKFRIVSAILFSDSIPFLDFLVVGPKFGCEKIEIGKIGKKEALFESHFI